MITATGVNLETDLVASVSAAHPMLAKPLSEKLSAAAGVLEAHKLVLNRATFALAETDTLARVTLTAKCEDIDGVVSLGTLCRAGAAKDVEFVNKRYDSLTATYLLAMDVQGSPSLQDAFTAAASVTEQPVSLTPELEAKAARLADPAKRALSIVKTAPKKSIIVSSVTSIASPRRAPKSVNFKRVEVRGRKRRRRRDASIVQKLKAAVLGDPVEAELKREAEAIAECYGNYPGMFVVK